MIKNKKSKVIKLLLLAASVVAVVVAFNLIRNVLIVHNIESEYQATVFAVKLTEDFVSQNGKWPTNWQALDTLNDERPQNNRYDIDVLKQTVVIDFDVDADDLANCSVYEFQAIRPIRPNDLFEDSTLRKAHITPLLERFKNAANQGMK